MSLEVSHETPVATFASLLVLDLCKSIVFSCLAWHNYESLGEYSRESRIQGKPA